MNDATIGVLVAIFAVAAAAAAGAAIHDNKISSHCQNYGKFTAQGKVYECKELGVAK